MKEYNRIIFVGQSGTSREPMAKGILEDFTLHHPVEVLARGLVVLFPEPLDAKAYAVLREHGYDTQNCQAQQLEQKDIGDDVLLLTMEERQKQKIWEQFENARNVYTLAEFIHHTGDILPLYGEPVESYEEWVQVMDKLLDELVIRLNERAIHKRAADLQKKYQVMHSEEVSADDRKEE